MRRFVEVLGSGRLFLPDRRGGLGIAGGASGINSIVEWDERSGDVVIVLGSFDPPAAMTVARHIRSWLPLATLTGAR